MVEEISARDLKRKLEADDEEVTVVDVSEAVEFMARHIPAAINIPMDRLPQSLPERDWTTDIVVVCPVGELSRQAARLIESYEGIPDTVDVASLEGGYADWPYDLVTPED